MEKGKEPHAVRRAPPQFPVSNVQSAPPPAFFLISAGSSMANELFEVVKSGAVKIEVHQTYPLKDAAKAHADLAARKTTGSTVLTV